MISIRSINFIKEKKQKTAKEIVKIPRLALAGAYAGVRTNNIGWELVGKKVGILKKTWKKLEQDTKCEILAKYILEKAKLQNDAIPAYEKLVEISQKWQKQLLKCEINNNVNNWIKVVIWLISSKFVDFNKPEGFAKCKI